MQISEVMDWDERPRNKWGPVKQVVEGLDVGKGVTIEFEKPVPASTISTLANGWGKNFAPRRRYQIKRSADRMGVQIGRIE